MSTVQRKVFLLTGTIMGLSALSLFGPPAFITGNKGKEIKSGHGLFDVDKPEAVQSNQDKREVDRLIMLKEKREEERERKSA